MSAWINLRLLGRGYRFRRTDHVLSVLSNELQSGGFAPHSLFGRRQCNGL